MQTLLLCPSLLGDGVPCQQTTTSAADLPLGPQNPVLSFSPPSQPTSNRGHPGTGITQIPLVPNMCMPRQHVIQRPRSPTPHICTYAHTRMHTHHAYDNTLAQCTTPWEYRKDPHLSRRPWPEGALRPLQLFSFPPALPPSAPQSKLSTWDQAALLPAWGG